MPTVAAFLVAAAGFGGCLERLDGNGDAEPLDDLRMPWGLTGCRFGVALIDVPAEVVAAYIPDGFRSLSVAEVGIGGNTGRQVPNPTDGGNFGVEVFQCDEGVGLDGAAVQGMMYGSYFTAVEPPPALRRDVTFHFVKWDTLVPDEPRRGLLQSYGLNVRSGTASVGQPVLQGSLSSYSGTLDFGGEETLTFEGSSLAPQESVTFVEYMVTPHGLAAWSTTVEVVAGGVGPQSVVVPSAGKATDILGAGTHRGVGFAGIANFAGGLIEAPGHG